MRTGHLFCCTIIAAFLWVGTAHSQDKSFKEMMMGAWLITSVQDETATGQKRDSWQGPASGQITFGRTGRFTQIILGQSVESMKGSDPRKPDKLVVAYFGTYSIDEANKKITGKVEAASYTPRANTEVTWTVRGSGDTLTLVGSPRKDQHGEFTPVLQLKRASAQ
jgi:hypothetical protein